LIRSTFQSETGRISSIITKPVEAAFVSQEILHREWEQLNFTAEPDYRLAEAEGRDLENILTDHGIAVKHLPRSGSVTIDSIYCRDASILTDKGAILCRMGKKERRGEQEEIAKQYTKLEIPVLGRVEAPGIIEGGDACWLDEHTLAIGRGYRTNDAGISQLRILASDNFEVIEVPLPHFKGPSDVFHLMSILSPLGSDLLAVYSPLLPVKFREFLLFRNFKLLEIPGSEFESMACNILTLAPGKCLVLEGNPITRKRLENFGILVIEYKGNEISHKGAGGPTCLTRPLTRYI
jgi:N-dimethylarginine dimethylaminohydrolase